MSARRSWLAAPAAAVLALVLAAPAAAKMPYFSVEVDPARPNAGEPITVTVRFWDDAEHTQPATWGPQGRIDDLLAFVPADGTSREWVFVPLQSVDTTTMRGTVTLPSDGKWTLTPWPRAPEQPAVPGYPAPLTVDVRPTFDPAPAATLGVLGVGWSAAALVAFRRRRARHTLVATEPAKSSPTER